MSPFSQKHNDPPPQWHHVRLEAHHLADFELERIKLLFGWNYMAARRPRGMSLWMAPDGDGVDIYLSPQAAILATELMRRYHASPCDRPDRSTVLIAGDGTREAHTGLPGVRSVEPTRRFLPVPYTYRCVRTLASGQAPSTWPFARDQMAPFVRRYVQTWSLFHSPVTRNTESGSKSSHDRKAIPLPEG